MNLIVKKTVILKGEVTPPGSKSQSIRAIILASLCDGTSVLENILRSDDTQDAIDVCRSLGAKIEESENTLTITSTGLPLEIRDNAIHSGNSGITTHFVIPILGLRKNADQPIILNCSEQMRARPIKSFVEALRNLGLSIHYLEKADTFPIRISGQLIGGKTLIDGITSQYLSALLFALPCASGDSEIIVKNSQSRPYAEMTLSWLQNQGIQFHHHSIEEVEIYKIKGKQKYKNFHATIASDFSSASYLIAASTMISSDVILQGMDMTDPQGDKRLVTILQAMGADIVIYPTQLHIRGGKQLFGIKIDANDIPDLLPTLAVIGTYASGKTEIVNAAHAKIKETDRIHSMTEGLKRMGAKIDKHDDGITVYQSALKGAHVKGYDDHRTVMALSIAGMIADGTTLIDNGEAINKTFPTFVKVMQSLGAKIDYNDSEKNDAQIKFKGSNMSYTLIKKLPSPEEMIQSIPLSIEGHQRILQDRQEINNILEGKDKRLIMIVGPCSAWPNEAVFEYAHRLGHLNKKLKHALKLVMRVYIQKPRTTKGWTGPVNQPDLFLNPDIEAGMKYARDMMVKVIEMGLPIADEALFTHNAKGFLELLSWVAVGARSSEDQEHRVFASAISCAVGMKNPTHGSLSIAVNSVVAAQHPHVAVLDGYEVQTHGNSHAHVVLRGSNHAPNYSIEHMVEIKNHMSVHQVMNPSIIIDSSHDNCLINGKKDPSLQAAIIFDVLKSLENRPDLKNLVKGFMVESFIKAGCQKVNEDHPENTDLSGLSITDPCLSWDQTEDMLTRLAMIVQQRESL